jgi:predicted SprT family Zn-dependent metalloprotease
MHQTQITKVEYSGLQRAYDFFNDQLFRKSLPQVLVTLHRKANSRGYFSPERFTKRRGKAVTHELALNPDTFLDRTDEQICSTLVHEMVHVWQQEEGKPSRTGYHNKEWAAKMKEVGLYPSTTGLPGGKEVGQRVTHYIVKDGPYAKGYAILKKSGFKLHWESAPAVFGTKPKPQSKVKFTCPKCEMNVWGAPTVKVTCTECELEMEAAQ